MVKDRLLSMGLVVLASVVLGGDAGAGTVMLSEAGQRGVFNVGASRATVGAEGSAVKVRYELPRGTAAGVWNKAFPAGLGPKDVDVVVLSARVDGDRDVAAALEIKGTAGTQRIPIDLAESGPVEHPVDWGRVGAVSEVVISVEPRGDGATVSGSITLDGRFEAVSASRKLAASPIWRIAGAAAVASLMGLAFSILGASAWRAGEVGSDLLRGAALALVAGMGMATFDLGARSGWDAGWWFLGVGAAGAVAAECWSLGLAGRHLSRPEAARAAFVTGLLAASSSPLAILQAPGSWSDLLRLSQASAAAAVVIYHLANARRLATTGGGLGPLAAALIAATPFLLGDLAILSRPGLVGELGGWVGLEGETAAAAGRVLALFLFNEAVALALGMATKGAALRSIRGHLTLLGVAAGAVVAPLVADLGSSATVGAWPGLIGRASGAILSAMVAEGGLWAEVYLVTGLFLDAVGGLAPSGETTGRHSWMGLTKGAVYSGVFMAILWGISAVTSLDGVRRLASGLPWLAGLGFGALAFPLVKTIFETFDGSQAFFRRAARAYGKPTLYLRGAVVGLGVGLAWTSGLDARPIWERATFGLVAGALAFGGVNLAVDAFEAAGHKARVRPPRAYAVQGLLGGFIGAAIGFYFDSAQVAVVVEKFGRYLELGASPRPFDVYPFLSKWGRIDLGTVTGGVKLLFDESLAGVISWAVPAWLFAINRTFMAAYFQKEAAPIRALVTPEGRSGLLRNMIEVLRWGLWMSPIINSFLRKMPDPTWYNQDGAIRTLLVIGHDVTEPAAAFRAWSLHVFTLMLAHDGLRVLIWLDHFGLRVATLVNLSFLGMDRARRAAGPVPPPRQHRPVHPRGGQAVRHLGPPDHPVLPPPGPRLGQGLGRIGRGGPARRQALGPLAGPALAGADRLGRRPDDRRRGGVLGGPEAQATGGDRAGVVDGGQPGIRGRAQVDRRTRLPRPGPGIRPVEAVV